MQSIGPIVAATGGDGVEMRASCVDHDDFGFDQPKIMNVIDSENLERDMQIGSRNPHKFDCVGKPLHTLPHPAVAQRPASPDRDGAFPKAPRAFRSRRQPEVENFTSLP
jgi:hypothetical protein